MILLVKIKVMERMYSFLLEAQGSIYELAFSSFYRLPTFLCSWSLFFTFKARRQHLQISFRCSCFLLVRTFLITFSPNRLSRIISPSQGPDLNHIYKVPLVQYSNIYIDPGNRIWTYSRANYSAHHILSRCNGAFDATKEQQGT